ncbi:Gfo/Idh/MocA family protein [Phytoactinopolyspora halotolerans]|uniref:Gfo/Idh/MocA family oxidoreductase n=1 Tax=Phytoactinopolyspora halotolerans TaxID=1981512 RepID=A0A6L9SEU0_9ACTN|nr:Gfo/Idh/MocA family oxidoreductase [Phytoactinopolyspora halotolerans]NEE03607.1 Gfo/Idh/MocA family oxidoreductase [Phytoactinopolyspora halotolerans]
MAENGTPTLGIGMVGYSFMGAAHSHAWRNAVSFFELPVVPQRVVIGGRNADAARATAQKFGWGEVESDWRALIARDDVDLVDVCTPGDTHAEIAIAALEAGKHVLCEKPLANTVAEAESMTQAAATARERGVRSMVGFTYRRVPAIVLARRLVAEGRIGQVRHVRAQYLQDWLNDPAAPMSWRLEKDRAGSGALGDIGAHVVDLTQYITGEPITGVAAMMETFVPRRPLPGDGSGVATLGGHVTGDDVPMGDVTVDDAAVFLARFGGGALATFEATRYATGRKNAIRIEINGSEGALAFDFEDMNVLHFYDATEDAQTAGFRRILVTEPEHPFVAAWWPPGHLLGYEHGFTHQMVDLVNAIADGRDPEPSFADGLRVQRVLAAVEHSAAKDSAWTEIPQ